MKSTIKEYVQKCEVCQRNKTLALAPAGLLTPLCIPEAVWEDLSMDFVEGLPRSHGKNMVLVVVDRLSKYAHFIGLQHPFTARTVAEVFVQNVVRLHGFPRSIVSDRDKIFLSKFWGDLFKLSGTKLCHSTAYHPQSDGQTEVVNKGLETYLRCFCGERPKLWEQWLPWAEYWYNTTYHGSTKMTPFQIVYGRLPPRLIRYETDASPVSSLDQLLQERDATLRVLKDNLKAAQDYMKTYADKKRREVQLEVGDLVYLRIRPYRQTTLRGRRNEKLAPKFFGPYRILAKVGSVAYRLDLPEDATIHPVFHVSQLRPAIGDTPTIQPHSPQVGDNFEWTTTPTAILGYRHNHSTGEGEVLVSWEGLAASEATWERVEDFRIRFPTFHLEDKVFLEGGGNVRPPITKYYKRRGKEGRKLENIAGSSEEGSVDPNGS